MDQGYVESGLPMAKEENGSKSGGKIVLCGSEIALSNFSKPEVHLKLKEREFNGTIYSELTFQINGVDYFWSIPVDYLLEIVEDFFVKHQKDYERTHSSMYQTSRPST